MACETEAQAYTAAVAAWVVAYADWLAAQATLATRQTAMETAYQNYIACMQGQGAQKLAPNPADVTRVVQLLGQSSDVLKRTAVIA